MKKELTVFAAVIALAAGAFEWDFTKGLPEGGKLRACAVLGPEGLSLSQISRNVTGKDAAGVMFPQVDLPEAFVFEAEVVPFVNWTNETDRAAASIARTSAALRAPGTSIGMASTGWMLAAQRSTRRMSVFSALPLTASAALRAAAVRPLRDVSFVWT